ncbi:MAG TPA: glycosyltransferase family 4 protein [Thermoanaerobaculia bacterium]|nr:glycosyltransferase family 4 protein [Thermoanaerobaculia bacterium]
MRIAIVGPVFPYRGGISYCTSRLASELGRRHEVRISSFSRQFPKRFYPGGDDVDPTLASRTPSNARFSLDVLNPFSWIMEALAIRRWRPDAVILVWWIWVWAIPYLVIRKLLPRSTRVVLQAHNVGEKESARWKVKLSRAMLSVADALIVHARSEENEARARLGDTAPPIHRLFLPVHEMGGAAVDRPEARQRLGFSADETLVLCFGHVRPYKGVDLALKAWNRVRRPARLIVAGEFWWDQEALCRRIIEDEKIEDRVHIEGRFIPDDEIALWFSAADLILAPYRSEAQSGVVMTAFHFGRAVAASTVGGMPEVVEDGVNGFLIPPESPEAIAEGVNRALMADREALERGARESAGKYSWERYGCAVETALGAGSEVDSDR